MDNPNPEKAYKDHRFLNSPAARPIRILAEFLEPEDRLSRYQIEHTIVFFGSARTLPKDKAELQLAELKKKAPKDTEAIAHAERMVKMSRYYEDTRTLASRLTHWSKEEIADDAKRFYVCSGGGPGIMEAANRGASDADGISVGLNISLPFEQSANPFQTRELAFEFHYFFIRKFWFFYLAKAIVVCPGGFGTMDEFFELLTLIQTKKSKKPVPIILYGSEYWKELIDFDAMVKWGVISPEDLKLFQISDSIQDSFDFLTSEIRKHYLEDH
ncbi:MAG TPA: LOG family protein [Verrucomicrobiales bacterium]|nr:LOG family protein [Verrucomicrobiales bacterium]